MLKLSNANFEGDSKAFAKALGAAVRKVGVALLDFHGKPFVVVSQGAPRGRDLWISADGCQIIASNLPAFTEAVTAAVNDAENGGKDDGGELAESLIVNDAPAKAAKSKGKKAEPTLAELLVQFQQAVADGADGRTVAALKRKIDALAS